MQKTKYETNPTVLKNAIAARFDKLLKIDGQVTFKAIPGLADYYALMMARIWTAMSKPPLKAELEYFTGELYLSLREAFEESPHSEVTVRYMSNPPPDTNLTFAIDKHIKTMTEEFADWTTEREGPLFGENPDAMVMNAACTVDVETPCVLDIGAGTGRNSIPLAEMGFKVIAVEQTAELADILRNEARDRQLDILVFNDDIFSSSMAVNFTYDLIVVSEVFSHFRSVNQVKRIYEIANKVIEPGGYLVFNAFVTFDGYNPSELLTDASEVGWCRLFKRSDLVPILNHENWELLTNPPVFEHEKSNVPQGYAWPPTPWFEGWCKGRDVIDTPSVKPPFEMQWFVFRKKK